MLGGVAAIAPTFLGVWLGQKARHAVSAETFRRIFLIGMFVVGLHMASSLAVDYAHMPLPTHKVTICGIPELSQHCSVGVSHVLSIIDTHEPRPPALDDYLRDRPRADPLRRRRGRVSRLRGLHAAHIVKVLEFGERVHARPDSHVLVHCHAGVSRSTAAAAILMCQHAPGQEEAAFLKLLELRKHGWPNTRMVEFADTLLEARRRAAARPGRLPRAPCCEAKPHLSEIIRNIGRGHELPV